MSFISIAVKRFNFTEYCLRIVELLFGYILLPISFLIKRDNTKWVFGNKDYFKDNTSYLYLYLLQNNMGIKPIWISSSKALVARMREKSLPSYYKYSIKGLYHTLTAGVYVSTVNSNHINYFTSGGAFKVYLWHGIALKSMVQSKTMPNDHSLMSRIILPHVYEKIDFFLSTTPMIDNEFMQTFNLSKETMYSGMYPRCRFMCQDKDILKKHITTICEPEVEHCVSKIEQFNKVYIYMPTWRLNIGKRFLEYALPDLATLNDVLRKNNAVLLLKLHPTMTYDAYKNSHLENIIYIKPELDLYPILPFTDVMITDYSSIYYDYLLMENKGTILYDFDYESYIRDEFSFFRDYKTYTPGLHAANFESLLSIIERDESCIMSEKERSWILHEMWGDYEHKNNIDLVNAIKTRIANR